MNAWSDLVFQSVSVRGAIHLLKMLLRKLMIQ